MTTKRSRPNVKQIASSLAILRASEREKKQRQVEIGGMRFIVLPGAFSPRHFDSTRLFSELFPYRDEDGFLEVGCGTGITSIFAAKSGAKHVLSVDINPVAVRNARLNAIRHGCSSLMESRWSDVFSNIRRHEQFDTIYWNLPFIYVDEDFQFDSIGERALFDPGYRITRRFFDEGPRHLKKGGRIIVGFGDFGDEPLLKKICRERKLTIRRIARTQGCEGGDVEFMLYEIGVGSRGIRRNKKPRLHERTGDNVQV